MENETLRFDRVLSLSSEAPPYTYHKTRQALAAMTHGQILRVVVSTPAAANNIRQNIHVDGHKVLDVSHEGEDEWLVTIRRN